MKLVGLLISLLIVALLAVTQWKSITGGDRDQQATTTEPPDDRFSRRCGELAPPKLLRPADYCRCLWQRGVRQMTHLVTDPQARAISQACAALQGGATDAGAAADAGVATP